MDDKFYPRVFKYPKEKNMYSIIDIDNGMIKISYDEIIKIAEEVKKLQKQKDDIWD